MTNILGYGELMLRHTPIDSNITTNRSKEFKTNFGGSESNSLCFLGGINSNNIKVYLKHNNIVGIGLSWIANENLVENSNWIEINRRAQLIMDL